MTKTVNQMTAAEYKDWMFQNPEEAKKLDAPTAAPVLPTIVWRNGIAVQTVNTNPGADDGVVQ